MRRRLRVIGWALVSSLLVLLLAVPARSEATGSTSAAGAEFPPGSGAGQGRIAAVQLRSSGVGVAVVSGRASARYQGVQGNAEASAVDPGLIGTALDVPLFCGTPLGSLLPSGTIPEPLAVSSGGGPTDARQDYAGTAGSPFTFGSQRVSASPGARAAASVTGGALDLGGVISASGGTTAASAQLDPERQRAGSSRTEMGSLVLGGGLVELRGLVWNAESRLGETTSDTADFSVGSMTIAGAAVPTGTAAEIRRSVDQANAALAGLGIRLVAPETTAADGTAIATAMGVTVTPTQALLAVVAPLAELIQPTRSGLLDLLAPFSVGDDCNLKRVGGFGYLVADLILATFGSGGGVDLLFGGASATTDDSAFANPFGTVPPPLPPVATSAVPAPPPSTTVATAPPRRAVAPRPVDPRVVSTSRTVCRTTHPIGRPACSDGRAQAAGLAALALAATLAAADRRRRRAAGPSHSEVT